MRLFLSVLLTGLFATAFVQTRQATETGTVTGTIVNFAGAGVAVATVELMKGPNRVRSTTSSDRGAFRFDAVPVGAYQVRATSPSIGSASVAIQVASASMAPIRLVLTSPAPPSAPPRPTSADSAGRRHLESVSVAAEAPQILAQSGESLIGAHRTRQSNSEAYATIAENGFHRAAEDPLSTFSIDVDTASYANVRRFLNNGELPPADAVRIEELINYFRFDYANPTGSQPFSVSTDVGPAPWDPTHRLVLVGLKARAIEQDKTPPRNLVFLLDVSGSMNSPDKLPLVKTAMRMLTATLTPADRVAIVVYAGSSGVALPSTSGVYKPAIERAITDLSAGGSTNGAQGIRLAYDIATESFIDGGINRVILATDGDFNVGVTNHGDLMRLIEEERGRGVFLSVLGVGTGNLKDATMEQLADRGNGNYAYLDSLHEARRVLVAEAGATLITVAKDVKIQVEFNPARVGSYRLIGYENRILAHREFNDDRKDAGDIGAGHTVTALYEIVPPGEGGGPGVDPLRYRATPQTTRAADSDELLTVKLRYKQPDGDVSRLISTVVRDREGALSSNLGFAAAVAEFGMLLRRSEHTGEASWADASRLARRHRGDDADGYRAEFIRLIDLASALEAQRERR